MTHKISHGSVGISELRVINKKVSVAEPRVIWSSYPESTPNDATPSPPIRLRCACRRSLICGFVYKWASLHKLAALNQLPNRTLRIPSNISEESVLLRSWKMQLANCIRTILADCRNLLYFLWKNAVLPKQ